ncbi:E3 SUMO-protein ligase RanBP2-like [Prorops nasuta]|uniref:E3 SUMO-protein ligase RanBP2-like n=1 Tax=Prorops nasuta TaxID=863751 RepID=UPI0034CF2C65
MFRSKSGVDRHVQEIFRKLTNEDEKILRSYNIAKLYYQVGDYESAKRYVSSYLKVRTGSAAAYKLLGQSLEALGENRDALTQYKISLELDGKQSELVLKVCELLTNMDLQNDSNEKLSTIKYWIDRADSHFPHHPTIFKLKEKMLTMQKTNENSEDLEELIKSELAVMPLDVNLHVKLLKFYLTSDRLDDAFTHAVNTEVHQIYRNDITWYRTLCEILEKCKGGKTYDWTFWIFYLSVLERLAALTVREQGTNVQKSLLDALFRFDQCLNHVKEKVFTENSAFSLKMFTHMWGQLHFHLACLYLWKTKREQGNWSEAGRICAPLFLWALNTPPINANAAVSLHVKDSIMRDLLKSQINTWHREAAYRCSQAGHILQEHAKGDAMRFMDKVNKFCIGSWRDRIYKRVFDNISYQKLIGNSYFVKHEPDPSISPILRLCTKNELIEYDKVAELVYPDSLHHHVWIGINSKVYSHGKDTGCYSHYFSNVFTNLQLTVSNLNQAAPESLSRLDIDAFLNATIVCSCAALQDKQLSEFLYPERFQILPADLTNTLCTTAQERWWSYAYQMYSKREIAEGALGEIRQELQRGLESVRCIGNHGLHPTILVHLARIFYHKVRSLKDKDGEHNDIAALEARCELYWSNAVSLLERLQNNQAIRSTGGKLFHYQGKEMNNTELTNALEEGRLFLAQRFLKDKQYEQAIDALQALKCPEASFQQGLIYKTLAVESVDSMPRDSLTSEMRSQHAIMLSKARNCFYLTLDRLRSPGMNPKHPLNSELCTHISEIENELRRIDPDLGRNDSNRNECDGMSEESYSSAHSGAEQAITNVSFAGLNSSINISSLPQLNSNRVSKQSTPCKPLHQDMVEISKNRTEARPSPERLDAQIRQMMHTKNNMMQTILEQNRALMETNKTILEKIDELTKDFAELKKESQRQRNQPTINLNNGLADNDLRVVGEEDYSDLGYTVNQTGGPPSSISGNMFVTANRNPYSQLMYPSAPPNAFQGYYQGGLAFNDPNAQTIPGLYPPHVYPISPMYPNKSKIPDNNVLQLGLFRGHNVMPQLSELVAPPTCGLVSMNPLQPAQGPPLQAPPPSGPPGPPAQIPVQIPVQNIEKPKAPIETKVKDAPVTRAPPPPPPPVNVVITGSDALTSVTANAQPPQPPTLSVTIPAQYRVGAGATASSVQSPSMEETNSLPPHSYQISMPLQATIPTTVNLPALPTSLLTTSSNMTISQRHNSTTATFLLNSNSPNTSGEAEPPEHDPIPDFVPVVPLPDEVEITTGEEGETTLYCERAKLFRFVNKEWKERGVGNVKLLKNSQGKVRLLMRRDQVLKICANHMLRPDMELTAMPNTDKAWMWAANDFADEEVKLEKLCIKFKKAEEARAFKECFDKAKNSMALSTDQPTTVDARVEIGRVGEKSGEKGSRTIGSSPGGIGSGTSLTSEAKDSVKPPKAGAKEEKKTEEEAKPNPFFNFSFGKPPTDKSSTLGTTTTVHSNNFNFTSSPGTTAVTLVNSANKQATLVPGQGESNSTSFSSLRRPHTPSPATLVSSLKKEGEGVEEKKEKESSQLLSLKDQFKAAPGSWTCGDCYLSNEESAVRCVACSAANPKAPVPTTQQPLSQLFKPAPGSWECTVCYCRNDSSKRKCASCEAPSPLSRSNDQPTSDKPSASILDKSKMASADFWKCANCQISNSAINNYCVACDVPKDPSMPVKPKTNNFSFASNSSLLPTTFSFGIPAETAKDAGNAFKFNATAPFTFGSPGKSFDFQFSAITDAQKPPVASFTEPATENSEGDEEVEEEEEVEPESDDVYFAPVIPMPDKIDVKTGEENEEILYSHRAKLFRYDASTKEWKERGLGDIKLLKHEESSKLRLVMRRDQIFKLCLNHFVTADLNITAKDEKTWCWNAADYSEGEIEYMQFACRFKTSEIAQQFRKAVDDARRNLKRDSSDESKPPGGKPKEKSQSPPRDIQVLYELKVTPEEKAAALKYQLPENFYAYKQKEDCTGCIGCKEPAIQLFESSSDSKKSLNLANQDSRVTSTTTTKASGIFSNPVTSTFSFGGKPTFGNPPSLNMSFAPAPLAAANTPVFAFGSIQKGNSPNSFDKYQMSFGDKSPGFVFGQHSSLPAAAATSPPPSTIINQDQLLDSLKLCSPRTTNKDQQLDSPNSSLDSDEQQSVFGTPIASPSIFQGDKNKSASSGRFTLRNPKLVLTSPTSEQSTTTTLSDTSSTGTFTNMFSGLAKTTVATSGFPSTATSTSVNSSILPPIFGTPSGKSLFGGTATQQSVNNSSATTAVFGSTTATTTSAPISLPALGSASNIFGGAGKTTAATFPSSTTVFKGAATLASNTFGTQAKPPESIFATSAAAVSPPFANKLNFSNSENKPDNKLFESNTNDSNVFSAFATDASKKEGELSFLTSDVTFSSLMPQGDQPEGFKIDPNFSFAGAGTSVFGNTSTTKKTNDSGELKKTDDNEEEEDYDENENDQEHDPHFEPIVPMPDAIEVRTGEEDEDIVFSQRAKLYRYTADTKEWKERGVGEMKLLYHSGRGTYRLLMRREQVHKLVCNFLLKPDIDFQPLKTSDRVWVWAGMNYIDDNPSVEELAIKLKTPEMAKIFKDAIDDAQQKLRERQLTQDKNLDNLSYDEQEANSAEDEEDDEDDERTLMFEKKATLLYKSKFDTEWNFIALGTLNIYYDSEIFGEKIILRDDDDNVLSNTIISMDTLMQVNEKECIWTATDYALDPPVKRTLKAIFSSLQAAEEMYRCYEEGLDCAKKADISDPEYYK